ncbi:MAG: RNA 2',3'-cyclic phosphodiesterase [Candidatus Omnitrophota bacterium]
MRIFIAIKLENEIKDKLSQIQEELKSAQADVRWVKPENIHLTLKFLGETPVEETKIPEIIRCLKELGGQIKPFTARISGMGAFPSLKSARVIWVGVKEDTTELTKLAGMIEDSLVKLGFPEEKRKFSAHLTLGRLRSNKNKDKLGQKLEKFKIPGLSVRINSIALFESVLHPTGAAYQKLSEISLSKI